MALRLANSLWCDRQGGVFWGDQDGPGTGRNRVLSSKFVVTRMAAWATDSLSKGEIRGRWMVLDAPVSYFPIEPPAGYQFNENAFFFLSFFPLFRFRDNYV